MQLLINFVNFKNSVNVLDHLVKERLCFVRQALVDENHRQFSDAGHLQRNRVHRENEFF